MSRVAQPEGRRGSLKWIQRCVNECPGPLNAKIIPLIEGAKSISWLSPLASDQFAEYRDQEFLRLLELDSFASHLSEFWPNRGPQWDALARTDKGDVLLIEAKAHVPELRSPPSAAGPASLEKIRKSLGETAMAYGAPAGTIWHAEYYQLANRLAHLYLLRKVGVPAWLILVNFVGDVDMHGPRSAGGWETAYETAFDALGISPDAALLRHVLHIYVEVENLN